MVRRIGRTHPKVWNSIGIYKMKMPSRLLAATLAAGLIATQLFNFLPRANAQFRPVQEPALADFDHRTSGTGKPAATPVQAQGEAYLKSLLPGARVDYNGRIGTPKFIRASKGFLTGPNGQ